MIKIIETHGEGGNGDGANYEIRIEKDGKKLNGFYAGPLQECPEDASLERDLGYAYCAIDFFKLGYEAGKNNEEIEYESREQESK